jgi:hypothetical protein
MTPEPTQDDRTMATLAHVLQLVGWFIAPLVIFLIKRESRFVSFHSLQALLLQLLYMVVGGVLMGGWFVIMFATVFRHSGPQNGPPPPVFFFPAHLAWVHGAVGGHAGCCHRVRGQSRPRRVGGISRAGRCGPSNSEDWAGRRFPSVLSFQRSSLRALNAVI